MCTAATETKQEQTPAPGLVIDDPAELRAGRDRELLAGPIQALVEFFGLDGTRMTVALRGLKVETGRDLACLKPYKINLVAGDITSKRINLLREWCRLRLNEIKKGR